MIVRIYDRKENCNKESRKGKGRLCRRLKPTDDEDTITSRTVTHKDVMAASWCVFYCRKERRLALKLLDKDMVLREMDFWNVPGFAFGAGSGEEILEEEGYGFRNLSSKLPMTPRSLCGIASCSKSFTAAVIGTLVDEGKVSYDTPIRQFLPDFALYDQTATEQATLRDLFYHRTGLAGHDAMWPMEGITRKEYARRLRYLEPNLPFRYRMQYSNVIYNLIGEIAEELSGKTWEELVTERILKPLGMERSCLTVQKMREDPDFAIGYFSKDRHSTLQEMAPWEMNVGAPAAGVNSCVHEMLFWLSMHCHNGVYKGRRILSERVCEEMHHGVSDFEKYPWHFPEVPSSAKYGMGWNESWYRGRKMVSHMGEIEGYISFQMFFPEQDFYMFLVANRHKPVVPFLMEMLYTAVDHYLGVSDVDWTKRLHAYADLYENEPYTWKTDLMKDAVQQKGTRLSHALEDYAGTYTHPAYGTLRVEKKSDGLILHYKQWDLPMEHFHYDTFRIRDLKEDTQFFTLPLTYHYGEMTGKIDGFFLPLEPTVKPVFFQKQGD